MRPLKKCLQSHDDHDMPMGQPHLRRKKKKKIRKRDHVMRALAFLLSCPSEDDLLVLTGCNTIMDYFQLIAEKNDGYISNAGHASE